MKTIGFDSPLYILPFDHRDSFETKMFGWHGDLNSAQTAEIAAAKQVIYEGLKAAIANGVPKAKAGILVDEQFGAAIFWDPLVDWRAEKITRAAAVAEIARNYQEWVDIFEKARAL